jgi:phosphohistidine phosphatase
MAQANTLKELIVMRHAKSSWDEAGVSDFERTLKPRGIKDAQFIAHRNKDYLAKLDMIFTSPANRAFQTTNLVCSAADIDRTIIRVVDELYETNSNAMLKFVKLLSPNLRRVMIVGHNPTSTDFVNKFLKEPIDNLPTSGLVTLSFDVENWAEINRNNLLFSSIDYPKNDD